MRGLLVALIAALAPFAVRADEPPVTDWSSNIETVVVTAKRPGPLIWRVTKGSSTVLILGTIAPMPRDFAWNEDGVRAAIKGARQVLLPPKASVGLFEGLWFLAWNSDAVYLPDGIRMEAALPDPLRTQFITEREALHRDADRYESLRMPLAGLRLEGDYLSAHKLIQSEPTDTLRRIARGLGVPSKPVADYPALPLLKQLPKMSRAANEACLAASLDDIQAISAHGAAAAEAWAVGDLDGLKANYSEMRFESCIQSMPSFAALFVRAVSDSTAAVETALARPGKTVIAVSIGTLLRQNGILDRLKARGLAVEAPGDGISGPPAAP